jgi:hypothetical protein
LGPAWNGGVAVDSPSSLSVTSNGHCLPWWPWALARPASLLLDETSTSRQGLRLKSRRHWNSTHAIVSVNLTPEERKRRLMYPTTLSTYTREQEEQLSVSAATANSSTQEHEARGAGGPALSIGRASRIITSLSVRCPRRPRERSSGADSIRPHDAAGLSGPPRTPATSFPSPVWTPAGHVGRRRIAPGPRRNPASVYAGPVPARHVGDMASRGAAPSPPR